MIYRPNIKAMTTKKSGAGQKPDTTPDNQPVSGFCRIQTGSLHRRPTPPEDEEPAQCQVLVAGGVAREHISSVTPPPPGGSAAEDPVGGGALNSYRTGRGGRPRPEAGQWTGELRARVYILRNNHKEGKEKNANYLTRIERKPQLGNV